MVFSAAKLFFAYGLGNALTFPMAVGATAVLMAERPTPAAVLRRLSSTGRRSSSASTLYAALLAHPRTGAADGSDRLRRASRPARRCRQNIGERWREHFGVDILDGIGSTEMLHIFLSNRPGDVRYGTTGKPVPGYEIRAGRRRRQRGRRRRGRRAAGARAPAPATATGTSATRRRATFAGRLDALAATSTCATPTGYYTYCGPHRRHAQGRRHLGVAVRGRGGADRRTRRCWKRRWSAQQDDGRPDQAQGFRRAEARQGVGRRPA